MKTLLSLLIFLVSYQIHAQHKCGVTYNEGVQIKQRMLDNRQLFTKAEVSALMNNRTTTWVPVTIQNIADASGNGRVDVSQILNMFCGLNELYATQNIQFFIYGPILNINNTYLHNDPRGYPFTLFTNKVNGTLNMFIGQSVNNQRSYYNPSYDFVFVANHSPVQAEDAAHELGHFFTLSHTFFGWENVDAEATYPGVNAPTSIGPRAVEYVARTGPSANCSTAADGFCDTHSDYYSGPSSAPCNYSPSTLDPNGNALTPNKTNIMSYYGWSCVDSFTAEQKTAISMDLAIRNWVSNSPSNTGLVTGLATAIDPLDGGTLGPITSSTVRLDWNDVTNATMYWLEVYGTLPFPPNYPANTSIVIYKGLVATGNSHFDLPTTNLVAGVHYKWRVRSLNQHHTCMNLSPFFGFEATTATEIKDLPIEQQMTLRVLDNPISNSNIILDIYSARDIIGSIKLYAIDGREVITLAKQSLSKGKNLIQIPAQNIPNGMYLAVLSTESGTLKQKVLIQQ